MNHTGITQRELATKLGVRPQTVNKWISGENTPPPARWRDIEEALAFDRGTFARLAGLVDDGPPGPPDVLAAIEADPRLGETQRALVITLYRAAVEESEKPRAAARPTTARKTRS